MIAVITPATLSIKISSETNVTTIDGYIPKIDYDRALKFGAWRKEDIGITMSFQVFKVLQPVATLGTILPIAAPFPNSSYSLDFYGPALSCDTPKSVVLRRGIEKILNDSSPETGGHFNYLGFVPVPFLDINSTADSEEAYAFEGLTDVLDDSRVFWTPSLDFTSNFTDWNRGGNPASFYVITPDTPTGRANKTTQCQLYNATYSVNITFDNGVQDIQYKTDRLNGVSVYDARDCFSGPASHCNPSTAYLSIMSVLGDILIGTHQEGGRTYRTRIGTTVLTDTRDFHYSWYDEKPKSVIGNMSMPDALEQMVENVTISLLSNSQFL